MTEVESEGLFAAVPRWWAEPVFGLLAVLAGIICIYAGTAAVRAVVDGAFRSYGSNFIVRSQTAYVTALLLLGAVYAGVGFGGTYGYLTARGFTDRTTVGLPDRDAAHWLTALAWLAPLLLGVGSLVDRVVPGFPGGLLDTVPISNTWDVPAAVVVAGQLSTFPTLLDGPLAVTAAAEIALVGGVAGPALGTLFHGVLQITLRRIAPLAVAVGTTSLVLALVTVTLVDLLGFGAVLVFAAVVGYAYDRTNNLAVPIVAYGVLNAASVGAATVLFALEVGQL